MRIVFAVMLTSLLNFKCYSQSVPCFNTLPARSAFECLSDPRYISVSDFNLDGKLDMAVVNRNSDNVGIFLATVSGSFAPAVYHYYYTFNPRDIVSADFDQDGDKDIAVTTGGLDCFNLMMGSPTGTFSSPVGSGGYFPGENLAANDFNNDGYPDLVTTMPTINSIGVYLNSGIGTFSMGTNYNVGTTPAKVVDGNFNGDAWPDLAVINNTSGNVSILLGSSTGSFSASQTYTVGNNPLDIAIDDFNNDLILDLAISGSSPFGWGRMYLLTGNGVGGFSSPVTFTLDSYPLEGITSGDFNNDGNKDIAMTGLATVDMTILLGTGNTSFSPQIHYMAGPSVGINAGDFNNDGNTDLVVSCENYRRIDLFKGDGSGFFGGARVYPNSATQFGISVDVNNDNYPDIMSTSPYSDQVSLAINNGAGGFLAPITITTGLRPEGLASADFNSDGNADLAVCNYNSNNVSISLGTGIGSFLPIITFSAGINPYGISIADFNNDSQNDLIISNYTSASVSALLSSGPLSFSPVVTVPTVTQPAAIVSDDFNGDNQMDIVVSSAGSPSIQVFLGGGLGTFTSSAIYTVGYYPFAISSADLNNDGYPDLVTAHSIGNNFAILMGTASGSFSPATFITQTTSSAIKCRDMNGDGNLDLVFESYQVLKIMPGDGTGAFNTVFEWPISSGGYLGDLPIADFNQDGNLDIVSIKSTLNLTTFLSGNSPTVSITGSNTTICAGSSFTLNASGASSYVWSSGSFSSNAIVNPVVNTTYTVTGSSIFGCAGNSAVTTVSVKPSPTVALNSGSVCPGNSFTLASGAIANYTFQNGGPIVSPSLTTQYSASASGTNGCVTTRTAQVFVLTNPTVTIPTGTICIGKSYTLQPTGAINYTFEGGSSIVSPTTNSTYTVIGINLFGCLSSIANSSVIVNPVPVISTNSGSICIGQSFTLVSTGAVSYTYQGGNTVVSPTTNTSYTVIGTSNQGCISVPSICNLTVSPLPVISVISTSNVVCPGQTVSLIASGGTNYVWDNVPGSSMITVTPNITTTYLVIGENSNNCTGSALFTQTVDICTGIEKAFNTLATFVYPNPTHQILYFNLSGTTFNEVLIYSTSGLLVFNQFLENASNSVDISELPVGIYFITLKENNTIKASAKIAKE